MHRVVVFLLVLVLILCFFLLPDLGAGRVQADPAESVRLLPWA